MTRAAARTWASVTRPRAAATGMLPTAAACPRLAAISSGRLWRRSAQAPTGRLMTAVGSHCSASTRPTSKVEPCSRSTTTRGSATVVTMLPSWLTACPDHSHPKSRPSPAWSSPGMMSSAAALAWAGQQVPFPIPG